MVSKGSVKHLVDEEAAQELRNKVSSCRKKFHDRTRFNIELLEFCEEAVK